MRNGFRGAAEAPALSHEVTRLPLSNDRIAKGKWGIVDSSVELNQTEFRADGVSFTDETRETKALRVGPSFFRSYREICYSRSLRKAFEALDNRWPGIWPRADRHYLRLVGEH
jgi:hypothetical protein